MSVIDAAPTEQPSRMEPPPPTPLERSETLSFALELASELTVLGDERIEGRSHRVRVYAPTKRPSVHWRVKVSS